MAIPYILWRTLPQDQGLLHFYHLRRSGGHAVIDWLLAHHRGEKTHYNQAIPQPDGTIISPRETTREIIGEPGEPPFQVVSFEDVPLSHVAERLNPPKQAILLLRDPFNTFASRLETAREHSANNAYDRASENRIDPNLWKQYAREFLEPDCLPHAIRLSFNRWHQDPDYRREIAGRLDWVFTDAGFETTPGDTGPGHVDPFHRWEAYRDDEEYLAHFDDEIMELSRVIFDFAPPIQPGKARFERVRGEESGLPSGYAVLGAPETIASTIAASEALATAKRRQQQGDLLAAERICRRILQFDPDHADTWHLLGGIAHQAGRHEAAVECLRQLIMSNPGNATYHNNLGTTCAMLGKLDEAVASYRRALDIRPDYAKAHGNLGNALRDQGMLDDAVASYRRALQIEPGSAVVHNSLGCTLREQGNLDEAAAHCRTALQIDPDCADAYNNLGIVLQIQGKLDEAVLNYERALYVKPDSANVCANLAAAFKEQRKPDEAVAACRRALRIQPDYLLAYRNLGDILEQQGRLEEAATCYREALQLEPEQPLWKLRMAALWPTVFRSSREMDAHRRKFVLDSERFAEEDLPLDFPRLCNSVPKSPFNLQFDKGNIRPAKEAYARIFRDRFPQETPAPRTGLPRIGFVVTKRHERAFLKSLGGILERMNDSLFEMTVICPVAISQAVRAAVRDAVGVLTVPEAFDRMLETIRAARFDLLYYWEVGTDSTNYFLPFFRLAPVQCTSWGIQVTSGIPAMDYYLSSELVEPEDAGEHYSETLVPARTLLTYQERLSPPDPRNARDGFGFAAGQHVYLCAQHLGKFHPDFDPVLAAILRQDAAGVIVTTRDQHGYDAQKLQSRFAETIPEVADRIVFLPRQAHPDYLRLVAAADVLLDPPYFGGVNTTYDGFSLGKAIVTVPSAFHRGRYTFGCYRKMGVTDCVASDLDRYVEIAVALGTDAGHRAAVERRIRAAGDALFEDIEAVREHERIFQELVEKARAH